MLKVEDDKIADEEQKIPTHVKQSPIASPHHKNDDKNDDNDNNDTKFTDVQQSKKQSTVSPPHHKNDDKNDDYDDNRASDWVFYIGLGMTIIGYFGF